MKRSILPVLLALTFCAATAGAQMLSIAPSESMPETEAFTVDIVLDHEGATVLGLELEIGFDPTIVELQGVDVGTWYTGAGLPFYFHDYTTPGTDRIHFAGSLLGSGIAASGTIATCRFLALAPGVSDLAFLLLDVRDDGNQPLPATHSTGDSIIIQDEIPVGATTFAEVKRLYR